MSDAERRFTRGLVELRGESHQAIGGYAAKFNRLSQNLGGFVEQINRSFFNKSASDGWPDVLARYNHDDNMLLGTTAGGTLRLSLDDTGLVYEVDPPNHRADVVELIARGDVRQSSFAFITYDDDWGMTENDFPMRTLISGQLRDVAPVNTPAYLDTSSGLRSLAVKMEADLSEVQKAAEDGELRKFFGLAHPKVIDLGSPKKTPDTEDVRAMVAGSSTETQECLVQVLQLVAAADGAVDVAMDLLSDLIGVPNPDIDDMPDNDSDETPQRSGGQDEIHPHTASSLAVRLRPAFSQVEQSETHSEIR